MAVSKEILKNSLLLEPLIDATEEVLKALADIYVTVLETKNISECDISGSIAAIMTLTGDVEGIIAIRFKKECAAKLAAKIALCDAADLAENEITEGVGELLNQIAGKFRIKMRDLNIKMEIGLPIVTAGIENTIRSNIEKPIQTIIFKCLKDKFALQMCLSDKSDTSS